MNELATIPQAEELATRDPLGYALQNGASVDVIERLMVVRRELFAENAKALFVKAAAEFQARCPVIVKRKFGAKNAYKYAPMDDIIEQTRELMHECGFSFSLTSEIEPGWVKAQCKITHSGGHSEVSEFKVPIDMKNPMMTDPQRYGGAMTFSKRYALCNGFGIVTPDEDTDARADRPEGKSQPQSQPQTTVNGVNEAARRIALKKRIWDRAKGHFANKSDALEAWLEQEGLITAGESLATLAEDRLELIAERVEEEFDAPGF